MNANDPSPKTHFGGAFGFAALVTLAACRVPNPPPLPEEDGVPPATSEPEPTPDREVATEAANAPTAREPTPSPAEDQAELRRTFDAVKVLATENGEASYYSDGLAGRNTASGQAYDPGCFTAAHRKLPFGSVVRVVRVDDGSSVYVRINDRGPFGSSKRKIDLSRVAAEELHMLRDGITRVRLEIVQKGGK